jgi:hypothetical protein
MEKKETTSITLKNIPLSLKERFLILKGMGKISGSLTAFFLNAAIKELERLEK